MISILYPLYIDAYNFHTEHMNTIILHEMQPKFYCLSSEYSGERVHADLTCSSILDL